MTLKRKLSIFLGIGIPVAVVGMALAGAWSQGTRASDPPVPDGPEATPRCGGFVDVDGDGICDRREACKESCPCPTGERAPCATYGGGTGGAVDDDGGARRRFRGARGAGACPRMGDGPWAPDCGSCGPCGGPERFRQRLGNPRIQE